MLHAGVAEATITPALGTRLSGYGGRTGGADAIHDDLRAGALVLEADGRRIALLACDLVGLPVQLVYEWRASWAERTGIPAAHILVCCSHTHAGPPTGNLDAPANAVGERERAYLGHLQHALAGALEAAAAQLHPARLRAGETRCRIQRNRRDRLPGPHGPIDDVLRVLCVDGLDADGAASTPLAVVVNYACHPVVLRQHNLGLSADYVASLRRTVTDATGAPCLFLQGACGDLVPDLPRLGTPRAPDGISPDVADQLEAARRIGGIVGEAAVAALRGAAPTSLNSEGCIGAAVRTFEASLATHGEHDARGTPGEPTTLPFEVQCLVLDGLALVGMPVEPLCSLGLAIRDACPRSFVGAWCVGYANGCYGYLAPQEEYPRGAYEVESAHRYYRQPAPFAPDTAARAVAAARDALALLVPKVAA